MKFLFILIILPFSSLAQDISGVWTGYMYNDTTGQKIHYELALNEMKGKGDGYSRTTFIIDSIKNIGIKSVTIKVKDGHYYVVDDKYIYNNFPEPPAKGVKMFSFLTLSENDTADVLSGIWRTNPTKIYMPLTGTIFLERKKNVKPQETLIVGELVHLGLGDKLSFLPPSIAASMLAMENRVKLPEKIGTSGQTTAVKEPGAEQNATAVAAPATINAPSPGATEKGVVATQPISINSNPTEPKSTAAGATAPVVPTPSAAPEKAVVVDEPKPVTKNVAEQKPVSAVIKVPVVPTKPPAAELARRTIENIRTVDIVQDSLIFSLYDNGTVDGDTVSILVNGQVVMPRVGLLERATNKTIYLTPEMGDTINVIMYAENLGSIPPNTGLLVVRDGEKNYEILFKGDLKKNAEIKLVRQKKN